METLKAELRQEQLASLIEKNMGLVVLLAKSFNPRDENELDEFIQLGRIGLWKAIKKHDPTRGTKLSTTAWHYIRWEILRELDKRKRRKVEISIGESDLPLETLSAYHEPENVWDYMPSSLTNQEREVIRLKLEGHTFVDIGTQLGYSHGWANKTFKDALQKISDANAA